MLLLLNAGVALEIVATAGGWALRGDRLASRR